MSKMYKEGEVSPSLQPASPSSATLSPRGTPPKTPGTIRFRHKDSLSTLAQKLSESGVIAVTGKMASGKNYVSHQLEQQGWKSIDCDLLVHQAIRIKTPEIIQTFSKDAQQAGIILTASDGSINRRALGQLVFTNPQLLAKQEQIVYPAITQMVKAFISENPKTIINATVLYKTPELLSLCNAVIFVTAPFFTRLFRARCRDHLPFRQILRRFHSQRRLLQNYRKSGKKIIIVNNR